MTTETSSNIYHLVIDTDTGIDDALDYIEGHSGGPGLLDQFKGAINTILRFLLYDENIVMRRQHTHGPLPGPARGPHADPTDENREIRETQKRIHAAFAGEKSEGSLTELAAAAETLRGMVLIMDSWAPSQPDLRGPSFAARQIVSLIYIDGNTGRYS